MSKPRVVRKDPFVIVLFGLLALSLLGALTKNPHMELATPFSPLMILFSCGAAAVLLSLWVHREREAAAVAGDRTTTHPLRERTVSPGVGVRALALVGLCFAAANFGLRGAATHLPGDDQYSPATLVKLGLPGRRDVRCDRYGTFYVEALLAFSRLCVDGLLEDPRRSVEDQTPLQVRIRWTVLGPLVGPPILPTP
jgi:hypothetical protein